MLKQIPGDIEKVIRVASQTAVVLLSELENDRESKYHAMLALEQDKLLKEDRVDRGTEAKDTVYDDLLNAQERRERCQKLYDASAYFRRRGTLNIVSRKLKRSSVAMMAIRYCNARLI